MAAAGIFLNLSFLLTLIASAINFVAAEFPPNCNKVECPRYTVVDSGDNYEIRRYNSPVWVTANPVKDTSFSRATKTGFLVLFDYIRGKNNYAKNIPMTAPVIVDVLPDESSFTTSFYVPTKNQANPPPAQGVQVRRWGPTYVAVRQFGGFVTDNDVGLEVAELKASLDGTKWAAPVAKAGDGKIKYTVAQYNAPFELSDRVNEIWFLF